MNEYKMIYNSPIGDLILISDGEYLTGLKFYDSSNEEIISNNINFDIFKETIRWLDMYFSFQVPDFVPKYKLNNLTPFRKEVLCELIRIPYGDVVTYQYIANKIASKKGIKKMSPQAVGGALGWNPICIIIPCHRVVGKNGSLTGYEGGMSAKVALLNHEGIDLKNYYIPQRERKCRYGKTL